MILSRLATRLLLEEFPQLGDFSESIQEIIENATAYGHVVERTGKHSPPNRYKAKSHHELKPEDIKEVQERLGYHPLGYGSHVPSKGERIEDKYRPGEYWWHYEWTSMGSCD